MEEMMMEKTQGNSRRNLGIWLMVISIGFIINITRGFFEQLTPLLTESGYSWVLSLIGIALALIGLSASSTKKECFGLKSFFDKPISLGFIIGASMYGFACIYLVTQSATLSAIFVAAGILAWVIECLLDLKNSSDKLIKLYNAQARAINPIERFALKSARTNLIERIEKLIQKEASSDESGDALISSLIDLRRVLEDEDSYTTCLLHIKNFVEVLERGHGIAS
jgi:hypothetical protein